MVWACIEMLKKTIKQTQITLFNISPKIKFSKNSFKMGYSKDIFIKNTGRCLNFKL